ncbi:MAG: DUF6338 family protein [Desulfovibrionaceae bacterium]|nr:DUF6338 family protein [Desulfovibrionaceae bacterium]
MNITAETLNILFLLVPGFISSALFRLVIPRKKTDQLLFLFEILAFSIALYVFVSMFQKWEPIIVIEKDNSSILINNNYKVILYILFSSIALPMLLAFIFGNCWHIKILRKCRISFSTNRSSAWHDVFIEQNRFTRVHLKDGRILDGHPMYYTESEDGPKYVYLYKHDWYDGQAQKSIQSQMHGILIPENQIEFIEFWLEKSELKEGETV